MNSSSNQSLNCSCLRSSSGSSLHMSPTLTPEYPHHPIPVQPLPHGGYQPYNPPYNQPYNAEAVAYNNDQGEEDGEEEEEEEEERDPYYRGYPPQHYPRQAAPQPYGSHQYRPRAGYQSEDVELRSPGVAQRFARHVEATSEGNDVVVMEESEEERA